MRFLRVITQPKLWRRDYCKELSEVSSDIVTSCLRTKNETLSIWQVESDHDIENAIAAFVSVRDQVNYVEYIVIPPGKLQEHGLSVTGSDGKTPFKKQNNKHYDITGLNYSLLGNVTSTICELLQGEVAIQRKSKQDVKVLLSETVKNGDIRLIDLKPEVQKTVEKYLANT